MSRGWPPLAPDALDTLRALLGDELEGLSPALAQALSARPPLPRARLAQILAHRSPAGGLAGRADAHGPSPAATLIRRVARRARVLQGSQLPNLEVSTLLAHRPSLATLPPSLRDAPGWVQGLFAKLRREGPTGWRDAVAATPWPQAQVLARALLEEGR